MTTVAALPILQQNEPEVKMTIYDLKFMTQWGFNLHNNQDSKCAICQNPLIIPSVEELNKGKLKCNVLLGKCNHAFHAECINTWIQKGSVTCPIDRTPWALSKELDSRQDSWKKLPPTNTNIKGKDVVKDAATVAKEMGKDIKMMLPIKKEQVTIMEEVD